MRGWRAIWNFIVGRDVMKSIGPDPREKAERHRRPPDAAILHDPAGSDALSPLFAIEARRQSEALRDRRHAGDDQAFVAPILELGTP